MRKTMVATVIAMILMFLVCTDTAHASNVGKTISSNGVTYHYMEATAYCTSGKTATGTHTRKGICASSPEHFGEVAIVYENDNGKPGKLIGYYEVEDTGGKSVSNGSVIDIWCETYSECIQFGRVDALVVFVKGCG